jgi:hypothetical protein
VDLGPTFPQHGDERKNEQGPLSRLHVWVNTLVDRHSVLDVTRGTTETYFDLPMIVESYASISSWLKQTLISSERRTQVDLERLTFVHLQHRQRHDEDQDRRNQVEDT